MRHETHLKLDKLVSGEAVHKGDAAGGGLCRGHAAGRGAQATAGDEREEGEPCDNSHRFSVGY